MACEDAEQARLRRVNLIEVLREEAEEEGRCVEDLPDASAEAWSEGQIRAWFARLNLGERQLGKSGTSSITSNTGSRATQGADQRHAESIEEGQEGPSTSKNVPRQPAVHFSDPSTAEFAKWFPGYARSAAHTSKPRMWILCLPCAGSAEDLYTSEGTGARRAPSPLLEWCRAEGVQLLAAQLPGRGLRSKEPPCSSAQEAAAQLLQVLGSRLQGTSGGAGPSCSGGSSSSSTSSCGQVPWAILSHSMGCWIGYELLQLVRKAGLPLPVAWCLSAMPPPDLPPAQRPWRCNKGLNEGHFKEECRGWDINEAVFSPAMWPMYQPLLRADFTLFDSYVFQHKEAKPLEAVAVLACWGTVDRRVTRAMVEGWRAFTTGSFELRPQEGHHLWPLHPGPKAAWLRDVTAFLQRVLGEVSTQAC